MLDRFPQLRYVVLEVGAGWLPHWLERGDEKYHIFGWASRLSKKPSELFRERCWISTEVDESTIPNVAGKIGARRDSVGDRLSTHRRPGQSAA